MTHRCLILSLSAILACCASTVRADRRLPRPAGQYSADHPEPAPFRQVDWEILAGCPECALPTLSVCVKREQPAAGAGPDDARLLYGNDLALEINRLNDGLADAPEPELYGDALAREINRLNDGLDDRAAPPAPRQGFRTRQNDSALASRSSDIYETDTYHQILGARGQWIFVPTDSPLGKRVRDLVLAEISPPTTALDAQVEASSNRSSGKLPVIATAASSAASLSTPLGQSLTPCGEIARAVDANGGLDERPATSRRPSAEPASVRSATPLDLEIFTPCAADGALPDRTDEADLQTSGLSSSSCETDDADATYNDPHCADPDFDAEVAAGESATKAAGREITPNEAAVPQADVVALPVAEFNKRFPACLENAELQWEMNHRAELRANDCQLDGTAGQLGPDRSRALPVAEAPSHPATTFGTLTGLAHQVVQPMKQAGGQIATGTARAVQRVLETVYQARGGATRHAQRAAPYRGL